MFLVMLLALHVAVTTEDIMNCSICTAQDWRGCIGSETTCSEGQECASAAYVLTEDVNKKKQVTKKVGRKCIDSALCGSEFSFNFKYANWKITTACDKDEVEVSGEAELNHVKCFGCIAAPSECKKTVDCRGAEDRCIKVVDIVAGNVMWSKGCASKSMCKQGEKALNLLGPVMTGQVFCCEGNLCNGARNGATAICCLCWCFPCWCFSSLHEDRTHFG
ncbi:hypothetical protein AGOR_G00212970 [Albula goreensis]|uniref:UPAR/Ly6 domain-containing protein n=1 Tax=Albula goreensis TaxID=1534307 RepID=A0A8T3CV20_9TELE|nr:hypothetical protein AGOR_G00212970 [Albula goreensis]